MISDEIDKYHNYSKFLWMRHSLYGANKCTTVYCYFVGLLV